MSSSSPLRREEVKMYIVKYVDKNNKSKTIKERTLREVNDRVEAIYQYGGKLLSIKGGDDYGYSK